MDRKTTVVSPSLLTELVRRFGGKAVTDIHPVISKDKVTGFSVSVPGFLDMEKIRKEFKEKRLLQRIEARENFLKLREETSKFPLDTLLYVFSGKDVEIPESHPKNSRKTTLKGENRNSPSGKISIFSATDMWPERIINVFGGLY